MATENGTKESHPSTEKSVMHPAALAAPLPPTASQLTTCVVLCCMLAGSAGLMYGYDLVVAGGVSIMSGFLNEFFPSVLDNELATAQSNYCKYDNQLLQFYSSSPSLSALAAGFLAGHITKTKGHKATFLWAGFCFIGNTVLAAAAQNLAMLFLSRIVLGVGIGFSCQASSIYISEIAPAKYRGALLYLFAMNVTWGIFVGNMVNFWTAHYEPWGWRLSLGIEGVSAILVTIAGFVMLDSPMYLIQVGKEEEAKKNLAILRGSKDIDAEFRGLVRANEEAEQRSASNTALFQRRYTPQVTMAIALPFFQQVAGNDAILFYGPFLFVAAGLGSNAALYSSVFTGAVAMAATLISTIIVDRAGRRTILTVSSFIMFLCISTIGILFAVGLRGDTTRLSPTASTLELVMVCLFIGLYRASWGPLAWFIPGEIFPQEIRSSAQSVTVFTNMSMKFTIAQTFLSMLCTFKYGMFFFFGGWLVLMGIFILFFLPETKGVPVDLVQELWKQHWFWGHFVLKDDPVDQRPNI